ncbi:hypothetical protein EDC01DRAFT_611391 [Geopyxis carbonaria]|nr:hypothetical protein EDC01DRAFT_611391 [Geopyxis carbonaria]
MSQLLSYSKARPSSAMEPPPNPSNGRRGSLSLTQTLSLDWTPPPPPADLEQIHASSSQAPGLTSFSLGSPPPGNNEQLSLNKLYSRVKSFAGAMRDAVGSPSSHASSPTRSMVSGGFGFGSEQYFQNSASRDSVLSLNTSEGGSDPKSPTKSPLSSRLQLHHTSNKPLQSRPSSRVSSIHSTGTNGRVSGEFVPPPALRKATLLASAPRTATESIAPDTVYTDRIDTPLDGEDSADLNKNTSGANLHVGFGGNTEGMSKPTVGIFAGAIGNVMSSTAGLGPTTNDSLVAREPLTKADSKVDVQVNESNYVDVDQDYESASDETISDSSDDDVVMLHSKLPARAFRSPAKQGKTAAKSASLRPPQTKSEPLSSTDRRLSTPTTADSTAPPNPNSSTSNLRTSHTPLPVNQSNTSLPQYSGRLSNYSQSKATSSLSLASAVVRETGEAGRKKRPPPVSRINTDQSSLLPGFRIGDRGSETESSPAGTQMGGILSTADRAPRASLQSLNRQGFDNNSSTRNASGTHGGGLTGSTEAVSQALRQLRMGNLTRDFWMKDEVCKDCFLCGSTFTAWRRKHHCRLCGQIFCSKCTTLISGDKFGHQGSMRVCSPCLEVVNDYQDESEEEDVSPDVIYSSPRVNDTAPKEPVPEGYHMPKSLRPGQTPLMAIPATRMTAANNPNRRSQILEIDADLPSPPRPTSARSMNALSRPVTAGSAKVLLEKRQSKLLPAFHADNILDPDLAPYMSDDDLSDDQQLSIFATIAPRISEPSAAQTSENSAGHNPSSTKKGDKPVGGSSSTASARARRAKSKSRGSINGLHAITGAEPAGNKNGHQRSNRRRTPNFIAPLQQRPQTRGKSRGLMRSINDNNSGPAVPTTPGTAVTPSTRTSRSASMRGPLAPTVELNTASLEHVKQLLRQLLGDAQVRNIDQWEKALVPILLKCTDDLNPDVRSGDDIDIRHYVKVKRIPGGKPGDTSYVSGVVFTKNLALKSMPRSISQPKIVVISFPIEYQRHQMQLMSLEPVIAQERDFLQNMVNRIVALRPTLLLVQKNISGLALQLLAQANIATAYLVKSSVIEAVARCAQADIFSSIDKLALSNFRLGKCASLDVKTYVSNDIPGRKKTFMYLSGCQKELGCTIVLRGAPMNTLAVIKQITELMVYVVYNLKLETCLMRDEFVVIPSSPTGPPKSAVPFSSNDLPDDIPHPTYYEDMVRKHETKILSASPFVSYMQPYLLTRARELERRLVYLRRLRDSLPPPEEDEDHEKSALVPNTLRETFQLVNPEAVHGDVKQGTKKATEVLRAIYDAEYDKALHVYETQKRQWENYLSQYDDLFDPFSHQSITILYSMVCTVTTVPCEGPEIRRLEFYYQDSEWPQGRSDTSLGQFIEHLCETADDPCDSHSCDKKMIEHHRSYVHGQARVSSLVSDQIACPIQGMQNTILMWSYCKICPNANTPAIPMSESSWKYSFGKYLELSFWSSEMKMRAGSCPHDLNRDHVSCFGYQGLTVVFQYDPIDLLEIVVPRTKITYKPEIDLRVKNENYTHNEEKIDKFFNSVKARLKSINIKSVSAELHEECKHEIEVLSTKAEEDHHWLITKLQEKYNKSKYFEIVPLNRALRALQEKVVEWDDLFTSFDGNYFPSEKDIRRLATLQLKKIFLDNASTSSLQSDTEPTTTPEKDGEGSRAPSIDGAHTPDVGNAHPPMNLSSDQAHDVLASVVEEDQGKEKEKDSKTRRRPPMKLGRTVSVPEVPRRRDLAGTVDRRSPTLPLKKLSDTFRASGKAAEKAKADKKLDRVRLSTLSKKSEKNESSIPRSIPTLKRKDSKVSSLAKHFEQLSKEFERERAREKRQLAAKRARALPVATSRPIVEVYRNVREAVEEGSDEETSAEIDDDPRSGPTRETSTLTESSDVDASDGEISIASDLENAPVPNITDALPSSTETSALDVSVELPRQHRSAWMKMLSNFWAERSASGWSSLEYPLHPTDHVFNDSDIIVREDEPSSLIAFALDCDDYQGKLQDIRNTDYSYIRKNQPNSSEEQLHQPSFNVAEHPELERSLLKSTGTHLKYQFQEGTAKMFCKIFYAEQFDALRRNCGIDDRYVESLSRCTKWDNKGGKSRSVFLKSQDERIVLKSLSPVETTAFVKFAPSYFQFMSEAFFHELPTVIAKMLGFYQIYIRNPTTGTEIRWDILVMENLFYDRKTTRIFDLKGSMRNRYTQATGDQNEVLLDENMVEFIYESPLFVREHSKKLLRASLWNDTLFLSKHHVMDYSLMIGIDEDRKELVVGIIDCIRTFTWDKKLESWVKEKGLAGGGRNKPTVTSPKEYKHRFREAMERYVLEAPRHAPSPRRNKLLRHRRLILDRL